VNPGRKEESQQRKKKESPLFRRGFTPRICKRFLVLVSLCLNVGAQQGERNMQHLEGHSAVLRSVEINIFH
jgi:hypothetical protein